MKGNVSKSFKKASYILANSSVTTKKLADKAVTNDKIADEVFNGISNTIDDKITKSISSVDLSSYATKEELKEKADISKTFYDKNDTTHEWKEGDVAFEYVPGFNGYSLARYGKNGWDTSHTDEFGSYLGINYALRAGRDHKFNIINKTYARKDATYSVKTAAGEGNGVLIKPYTYVSGEEYVQRLFVMTVLSNLGTLNSNTGKYEFTMRSYPAYNILEYPYYQAAFRTDNGITCSEGTGDNWGRIYLSGTATADTTFLFWDQCPLTRFKDIKSMGDSEDIDYHLSGIPSGKSASETTYYLSFEALTADNTLIKEYYDTGNGVTIPYNELSKMAMYRIAVKVKSGTTIPSEVIIDPRLALDGYHTGGRYYNNMLTKPSPLQNKVVQCSGMISEYHSVDVITGETDAKDSNGNTITVTPISFKLANDNGIPVFIRLLDKTKVVAVECHYYEAPSSALSTQVKTLDDKINQREKTSNKVIALSSSSTDAQYPTAKAVYDELNSKQDKLDPQKYFVPKNEVTEPKTNDKVFIIENGDELTTQIYDGGEWAPCYSKIAKYAMWDSNGELILNQIEAANTYLSKSEAESTYVQPIMLNSYQPITSVVTVDSSDSSVTLNYNFIFNFGERAAITITLPTTIANDYITGFTFVSGATPTSLTMPTEIKFSGVDCFDGSFTPTANKTYQVIISRVATEFWGDVDARDYEAPTEETA